MDNAKSPAVEAYTANTRIANWELNYMSQTSALAQKSAQQRMETVPAALSAFFDAPGPDITHGIARADLEEMIGLLHRVAHRTALARQQAQSGAGLPNESP